MSLKTGKLNFMHLLILIFDFQESSWTFINSNNQALVFILIVLLGIVIFGSLYVTVLCYALRGKLDFVYDQESGQPLNVIQIKGKDIKRISSPNMIAPFVIYYQ